MKLAEQLVELSHRLEGFEVVPGVELPAPTFEAIWEGAPSEVDGSALPRSFAQFVHDTGAISAMDTAGGVAFLRPDQIREHLSQDYGDLLRSVDGVRTFPFGVNSSGSYLLLALDDSGVWKFNAHMHPIAKPLRIADSFEAFLACLVSDWEAVLAGQGGPYSTS